MTVGIVCEYNPFHNGHLYQIKKAKEKGAEHIVCVMSGNYVQRGDCAYFDKWFRAECAVLSEADVVIDLPLPWCMSSAENFAVGAVSLLCSFGVDAISFGSEFTDIDELKKCAFAIEDKRVAERLRQHIAVGKSYPSAVAAAVNEIYGEKCAQIISAPNSTLAVEYIRALNRISPDMKIIPIGRMGVEHNDNFTCGEFASASKIREINDISRCADFIPENLIGLYESKKEKGYGVSRISNGERAVLSTLRAMNKENYARFVTDESGLAGKIFKCVKDATSIEELFSMVKSKNYTLSRVRREVLNLYLQVDKSFCKETPPYIKVLAVNEKGLSLLRRNAQKTALPIITRNSETLALEGFAAEIYKLQCAASDKYALFSEKILPCGLEQNNSIKILKTNSDNVIESKK